MCNKKHNKRHNKKISCYAIFVVLFSSIIVPQKLYCCCLSNFILMLLGANRINPSSRIENLEVVKKEIASFSSALNDYLTIESTDKKAFLFREKHFFNKLKNDLFCNTTKGFQQFLQEKYDNMPSSKLNFKQNKIDVNSWPDIAPKILLKRAKTLIKLHINDRQEEIETLRKTPIGIDGEMEIFGENFPKYVINYLNGYDPEENDPEENNETELKENYYKEDISDSLENNYLTDEYLPISYQ